jgi:hypothetical protein
MARVLKPSQEDVFYDLGSVAASSQMISMGDRLPLRRFAFRRSVSHRGLKELDTNALSHPLVSHNTNDSLLAKTDPSDGTIYFMYSPFGLDTMRDALHDIEMSLLKNPRRITIVYHNALLEAVLDERSWPKNTVASL